MKNSNHVSPSCRPARLLALAVCWATCILSPSFGRVELAPSVVAAEAGLKWSFSTPNFCEVIAANERPAVLLRRELPDDVGLTMSDHFMVDNGERTLLLPSDYSNLELVGIDNQNGVLAVVRRVPQSGGANQRSVIWRDNAPEPEWLPIPDGFRDAVACAISRDGQAVSGYVLGRDPARFLPCVWVHSAGQWSPQVLESPYLENPLLTTAHVVISDNGLHVAASLVNSIENEIPRYALFQWRRGANGIDAAAGLTWQREKLMDQAVHLADINDQGMIAGRMLQAGRRVAIVYRPDQQQAVNLLPEGFQVSTATGINVQGIVVGIAESSRNVDGGPQAFAWRNGQFLDLKLPADILASKANCITPSGCVGGMFERPIAQPDGNVELSHVAFLTEELENHRENGLTIDE